MSRFQKIVIASIIFVLITNFPSIAASTVKAGSSCTKLNQVAKALNTQFKCVRNGKKLVWTKLPNIQKPLPTSTPAPTQTPTPIKTDATRVSAIQEGSACNDIGQKAPHSSSQFFECRMTAGGKLEYFLISQNPVLPTNNVNFGKISDCQIPDLTNRDQGASPIGYKSNRYQNPEHPTEGSFDIALIPVDYQDSPGGKLSKEFIDQNANKIEEWFTFESNSKLKVKVQRIYTWLRAPKKSEKYNWNHPGTANPTDLTNDQIGQDFVNIADKYIDFTNVGAVFILNPNRMKTIEFGMSAHAMVHTDEGNKAPFFDSSSYYGDIQEGALWAYWVHGFMHHVGMTGHAPTELYFLDLMDSQSGFGLATTTWNQLLIDWLPSDQLYCKKLENISSEILTLVSVDSLSKGIRSAMIPISDHEIIVIESRRKEYWTTAKNTLVENRKEVFDGFYGISVYLVDTKKDNSGKDGFDPSFDASLDKFARYLKIASNRPDAFKDVRSGLNYLMLKGESVTFRNLRISLIKSGDFDTIKLEKI